MPTPTGVGTEELRRANLRAILQTVHTHGPTTRAVLTKQLGLNRSTIGALTGELQTLGLVTEQTAVVGGRGRPSHLVVPSDDNVVVAVDVGVDRIAVALVGLGGEVLDRRTRGHQRGEHDVAHVVESVAQMIDETLAASRHTRCLGIGVAVPGAVRAERRPGPLRAQPGLGRGAVHRAARRSGSTGRSRPATTPTSGVLAEHIRGAAVGFSDVAYLSASVGIGGGFLVGGRPLTGASGYAGEVGHMQVDSAGPDCRCGAVGCWETKVGENVLLQRAGRLAGGGPAGGRRGDRRRPGGRGPGRRGGRRRRRVVRRRDPGDRQPLQPRGRRARRLARPGLAGRGDAGGRVASSAAPCCRRAARPSIRSARLGDDSPLIGAAELAFGPVLDHPQAVPQAV